MEQLVKATFITTVLNEENSIEKLLESLNSSNLLPDQVIIADGGSKDKTIEKILSFQKSSANKLKIKLLQVKGNRSIGRNAAIKNATTEIIICSDAGCELDKDWSKNILETFKDEGVDVVAGYYKGKATAIFQKCIIPYVLVMPDKVNPDNFLPATRSMGFKKSVWEKTKGFDEKLSHNEDFAFARKIKKQGYRIAFAKEAIVYWHPPKNIKKVFIMFYRFAYGDGQAGILRPKVSLVFLRYLLGTLLLFLAIINKSMFLYFILLACAALYVSWSILKNYRYVKKHEALVILPFLQFTSDIAVILGTPLGLIR